MDHHGIEALGGRAEHARRPDTEHPDGYVELHGRRFYRIADYDRIPPFFMSIIGAGDPWLFVSSTGGLTAGRIRPDSALFPYYTDDKVSESAGRTGGLSLLRVTRSQSEPVLWEPFGDLDLPVPAARRNLYKDDLGTTLVFEEQHAVLGLRLRVSWQTSPEFGIVRSCELTNLGSEPAEVELVDGLVNVLPAGVDVAIQNRLSNLLDAYKRCEVDPDTGLGIFSLSSRLTDLAEPSESLHANVAWHVGLGEVAHLASTQQVPGFRRGGHPELERDVRGFRGAYLVHARLDLAPGRTRQWHIVGDVELDGADVMDLRDRLTRPEEIAAALAADVRASRADVSRIIASADGVQLTGEELATSHHAANVLFNVMRGGVPVNGYQLDASDFQAFVAQRSPRTSQRCSSLLTSIPRSQTIEELIDAAADDGDPHLLRLAREYLPLTFSRRHGDPSRPWNSFEVVVSDAHGEPRPNFEGNWRDIFQNWEALGWSYPEYLESMITVFLDATTADGYNPYRISRAGIDWEVPDPEDPWANIGYWSDHQIVYLRALLDASARFHPGRLQQLRDLAVFTHADVPYRIAGYDQILVDPYDTISFDEAHAARIDDRVAAAGADGRLVHGPDGDLVRVTLAEKLLLLLLAKVVNLVPEGGIWMNTQRPEWNDANNALVGRGLSVVTLAQLRRFVVVVAEVVTDDTLMTEELAGLLAEVTGALEMHRAHLDVGFTDAARRECIDDLGAAGTTYRARVYAGFSGVRVQVPAERIRALLDVVGVYVESTLLANEREDGLFHSYNVLELATGAAGIRRLPEMLEGQVALLASGQLGAAQSLAMLGALRASRLYRADQHSYLLYPDKDLPGFLERNRIAGARAEESPLVTALLAEGDRSLLVRDVHGGLHFAAAIRNAGDVAAELDRLAARPDLRAAVEAGRVELLEIFEQTFGHAEFTGRSGSFFAYEGLGSIYWHMVSKLLLAVQDTLERAVAEGESAPTIEGLRAAYEDIRAGLGYCKSAQVYGAFPTDPYSHTPAGRGARQPGMTGQVKEEVLTRFGELGLRVEGGRIVFRPVLLRATEWLAAPARFEYLDVTGQTRVLDLPADALAFTFCQVPVVYRRADRLGVRLQLADGSVLDCPGTAVQAQYSASIFTRTGIVERIEVGTPSVGPDAPSTQPRTVPPA